MKATGNPVVLTVNGKAELVVQDAEAYQKLLDTVERLEVIAAINAGLRDVEKGEVESLESFKAEIQDK